MPVGLVYWSVSTMIGVTGSTTTNMYTVVTVATIKASPSTKAWMTLMSGFAGRDDTASRSDTVTARPELNTACTPSYEARNAHPPDVTAYPTNPVPTGNAPAAKGIRSNVFGATPFT